MGKIYISNSQNSTRLEDKIRNWRSQRKSLKWLRVLACDSEIKIIKNQHAKEFKDEELHSE